MAQRLIHYLIGELLLGEGLEKKLGTELNIARFRLGNLLPDGYSTAKIDPALRKRTHFIRDLEAGERGRISDFEEFRRRFEVGVAGDGLYLGYYLHLAEDACFRVFWHSRQLDSAISSLEDVSFLHRDYHILNKHLVRKYSLEDRLAEVENLEAEEINCIHRFDQRALITAAREDLADQTAGSTRYLTERDADEFIEQALPVCKKALAGLENGAPLDPKALAWRRGGA